MKVNFVRCGRATIPLIIVLLIFENVFCLEKSILSCVIFYLKLLYLYDFQACKYQLKYCIPFQFIHAICLTICGMLGMCYAREVAY